MIFCEHCNAYVPRSTYYRHRKKQSTTNILSVSFQEKTAADTEETFTSVNENNWSGISDSLASYFQGHNFMNNVTADEIEESSIFEDTTGTHDDSSESKIFEDPSNDSDESDGKNTIFEDATTSGGECDDDKFYFEDDGPEVWEDISIEQLMSDFHVHNTDTPCPEPRQSMSNENIMRKVTSLLTWFIYFLLLWQSFCKLSDNGLEWLLCFQAQFLKTLASICNNTFLTQLAVAFPSSLYLLRKFYNLDRDSFKKYAVCCKCSKLYELGECTEIDRHGNRVVKHCQNKKFQKSKPCGAPLSKKVLLQNGQKHEFYPLKVYCYNSVIASLEKMLQRTGIPDLCEKWKDLQRNTEYFSDIIDGNVWNEFKPDFLDQPRNYMFMLNFDFFQPLKHRNDYSVGVLYLANLNLPRHLRFKWENIIVAGIIPDLEHGTVDLNEFLTPLVEEMKALWSGLYLKTSLIDIPLKCRAALACISCDIPAARKLCGFKCHNANYGCSRCLKHFPGNVKDSFDYSGFEREKWPKRSMSRHRANARKLKGARSKTAYAELSKQYGMYYSVLVELEYFDLIRCHVIDPMHNLFLGTAKSMFKLWTENDYLKKKDIQLIESRIKDFDVGTGLGRLPHKISSNYGCYTAAQWKNWTLVYSMHVLNGILPEQHLRCWQAFVLACKFLTRPVVSRLEVEKADMMLMNFCNKFEKLYGKDLVKPNMHLHGHLKECVLDFGPIYNFWCFSFERYNGILSSFKTNNRCIEVQLMRQIIADNFLASVSLPPEFENDFQLIVQKYDQVDQTAQNIVELGLQFTIAATKHDLHALHWESLEESITLPKYYKVKTLDEDDLTNLNTMYHVLFTDEVASNLKLAETVRVYSHVMVGNEKFGSRKEGRSIKSSRIHASWSNNTGNICTNEANRPGVIQHFVQHKILINQNWSSHVLAVVDWFEEHESKEHYGKPVEVWKSSFVDGGPSRFLPVARINSNFVIAQPINHLVVIVPLNRTFSS